MADQILYYCHECNHVYFKIPSDKLCTICGNEIDEEDTINENDILKCETCHSIYNPTSPAEVIPKPELNEPYLCACKNACPTRSSLQIKQERSYVGNIVIAKPSQCSNCKAVFFRSLEERHKECTVCKSRTIIPVEYDSKTQKIFYKCANPAHNIRLKFRDVFVYNNKAADADLLPIRQREQVLIQQYQQKQQEIKSRNLGLLKRGAQQQAIDLKMLDQWANQERFKLYDMPPRAIRCAVFKENPTKPNDFDRVDGCDAVVEINIKKVLDSDTKSTQIKRKVVEPPPIPSTSVTSPPAAVASEIPAEPVTISTDAPNIQPLQSIISNPGLIAQDIIRLGEDAFNLITPEPNLLKLKIELFVLQGNESQQWSYIPVNTGVGSIKITKDAKKFRFGREFLVKSLWSNPDFFTRFPFIFDNIGSVKEKKPVFEISLQNSQLILTPASESITELFGDAPKIEDGKTTWVNSINQSLKLVDGSVIFCGGYYALDKERLEYPHRFLFKISFQFPNNVAEILG
jgi:hypothetical protein